MGKMTQGSTNQYEGPKQRWGSWAPCRILYFPISPLQNSCQVQLANKKALPRKLCNTNKVQPLQPELVLWKLSIQSEIAKQSWRQDQNCPSLKNRVKLRSTFLPKLVFKYGDGKNGRYLRNPQALKQLLSYSTNTPLVDYFSQEYMA